MNKQAIVGQKFLKMHGAGNDFVVLDARTRPIVLDRDAAQRVADRRTGVGCDQLIIIEPTQHPKANAFMRILNADGSEVAACGNATRCVAWLLLAENGQDQVMIETKAGLLWANRADDDQISVDMGPALLDWKDIPLASAMDSLHLPLTLETLSDPVGVGMGNPHAVFFVDDVAAIDLAALGPILEHDPLFPERCNIEVVEIKAPGQLRMRVWERGAGITRACGTGACASVVAAARRNLGPRHARVELDGGVLDIHWRDDNHVVMTGPVALSFTGTLDGSVIP